MDENRARQLLQGQREEVQRLLGDASVAGEQDRAAEQETGDSADPGPALAAEGVDDAVAAGLRERLAAIDRAEKRLADGTYGLSIRSGDPIPDERLEFDPAAELTVEEAAQSR
ncbi:MAG: TraR/DksA family transcriptional regulator [Jatrophihabitantaceae bacterium]